MLRTYRYPVVLNNTNLFCLYLSWDLHNFRHQACKERILLICPSFVRSKDYIRKFILRCEKCRHFRKKKRKYLKIKINEISNLKLRKENRLSLLNSGWWGRYLWLRGKKQQEAGENSIIRKKKERLWQAFRRKKDTENTGGENWTKESTGEGWALSARIYWMSFERWYGMSCTGLIWIRTKQIAVSCKYVNEYSGFSWLTKEKLVSQV